MRKPWSKKEDGQLRELISLKLTDIDVVSRMPGRSLDSVRRSIRRLGLIGSRKRASRRVRPSARKPGENLIGKKFDRWLVIGRLASRRNGQAYWKCRCRCGVIKGVCASHLKRKISRSCGCRAKEVSRGFMATINDHFKTTTSTVQCASCGAKTRKSCSTKRYCSDECARAGKKKPATTKTDAIRC